MSPEEAMVQLREIVHQIDVDKDGYVTKAELTDWITKSFK